MVEASIATASTAEVMSTAGRVHEDVQRVGRCRILFEVNLLGWLESWYEGGRGLSWSLSG